MSVLWMLFAGALFSVMSVFAKLAAGQFSSVELVFYRSALGLAVLYTVARGLGLVLRTPGWRWHLSRSLFGMTSLLLYFHCIGRLPLATAVTLNYTSPLFLALFTTARLGERPTPALVSALLLGFVGIVLLLQPSLAADQIPTGLLGLVSGALAAMAYFSVRRLGEQGEPDWRVVFYFLLVSTVLSGAWLLADGFSPITASNWWLLAGLALSALVAQVAMTRALQSGRSLVAGTLSYSTLVFSAGLGATMFAERLAPLAWIGIALIVASGALAMQRARR